MFRFAVAGALATAEAGTLAVTWKDCGAKHATVTDVQPTTIHTGATETLTGTGTTDEDVTSAQFTATVSALGAKLTECSGDATSDIVCTLPMGVGKITVKAVPFPLKAGTVQIPVEVQTSSVIPPSLANVDVHIAATDQNGEDTICLDVHTAQQASFGEIAAAVNAGNHGWTAQAPENFATVDDVLPYLGAFLPGDEEFRAPEVVELPDINSALPDSFDSATKWPKCSVIGNVRDQSACGSCWAFGSTCSFESRRCIATGDDIKFSPEDTAFNSNAGFGCSGGNSAWTWFHNTGVVTGGDYEDIGSGDTCLPYTLAPCAHHVPPTPGKYPACPGEGPSPSVSKACSESGYSSKYNSDKAKASSAYSVKRDENQIKQDLVTHGPMYVAFTVYSDFPTYKSGVYVHTPGSSTLGGHAVTLVGYGELDGTPYWKIKNSWNEEWGDAGHFLIKRGSDECGIESSVSAGLFPSTEVV
jgi:cathepsin B